MKDHGPDHGCGLDWSILFPVHCGYGPVFFRSFSGLVTGPANTKWWGSRVVASPHPCWRGAVYGTCYWGRKSNEWGGIQQNIASLPVGGR
jgi:hypothetical protein